MEIYKWAIQKLSDGLTCPMCGKLFTDPVIMDCGHNFCLNCAGSVLSEPEKENGCCRCPHCQMEWKSGKYIHNHQLGKVSLTANLINEVISLDKSRSLTMRIDWDSGMRSDNTKFDFSLGTPFALANTDGAPTMRTHELVLQKFISDTRNKEMSSPNSTASMTPPSNMSFCGEQDTKPCVGNYAGVKQKRAYPSTGEWCSTEKNKRPYIPTTSTTQSREFSALLDFLQDYITHNDLIGGETAVCQNVQTDPASSHVETDPASSYVEQPALVGKGSNPGPDTVKDDKLSLPKSPCISAAPNHHSPLGKQKSAVPFERDINQDPPIAEKNSGNPSD